MLKRLSLSTRPCYLEMVTESSLEQKRASSKK